MQSHDDVGHCAPDTNGCGSKPREGHSFDERMTFRQKRDEDLLNRLVLPHDDLAQLVLDVPDG